MSAYNTLSEMEWMGLKSQKWTSNRSHRTIPQNQLNFRLQSTNDKQLCRGRQHFDSVPSQSLEEPFKKHLKTFGQAYQSKILDFPLEKKLVKLHGLPCVTVQRQEKLNRKTVTKQSLGELGRSKMKALQSGEKKIGIYRNFYKSLNRVNGNSGISERNREKVDLKGKTMSAVIFPSQFTAQYYNNR